MVWYTAVMARPLRVDVKDGWYHVTARGIERMAIFEDDRDHEHFLELLEEMSNRYGVEVHVLYLNPIRTEGYGLGKSANKAEAMGWVEPDREQLKRRLKALRQFHLKTFEAGKFWVSRITATDARLPALFSATWRMGRRDPYDPWPITSGCRASRCSGRSTRRLNACVHWISGIGIGSPASSLALSAGSHEP